MVEKMGAHQFRSEPVRVCRVIWWDHDARAAGFAPGPLLWNSVCAFDVCGFGKEGTICFAFKLLGDDDVRWRFAHAEKSYVRMVLSDDDRLMINARCDLYDDASEFAVWSDAGEWVMVESVLDGSELGCSLNAGLYIRGYVDMDILRV
jgi:hypothetical protein